MACTPADRAEEPLRLGLIGAGRWGRNYISTVAALEGVTLAWVASRNPATSALTGAGCPVVQDWRAALATETVDGIIVATPPSTHSTIARAAVERGLPVLVEKPLTLNLAEAEDLRVFVRERGGHIMVGHTHLFHPAFRRLKELTRDLGAIEVIDAMAGNWGPYRAAIPALWDWGAHDLAMCIDLAGVPLRVTAEVLDARHTAEGFGENFAIRLAFAQGVTAKLVVGTLMNRTRRFCVQLRGGTLVYDDLAPHALMRHAAGVDCATAGVPGEPVPTSAERPLSNVVGDFARALRGDRGGEASLDLGVEVVRALAACEAASRR